MLQESIARIKQSVKARYWPPIVRAVTENELTWLDGDALNDLYRRATQIEADTGKDGILIEAGCALGGSAIVMAAAKSSKRPLYLYDAFELMPPPKVIRDEHSGSPRDFHFDDSPLRKLLEDNFYSTEANLLEVIADNFAHHGLKLRQHNIHVVKGSFQDTMRITAPVALAHIDRSDYDDVMTCLTRIVPRLIPGGVLVIDDYDTEPQCRSAVDRFFSEHVGANFNFVRENRLQIIKN